MNSIRIPRSLNINLKCNGSQRQPIGIQSVLDGKKIIAVVAHVTPSSSYTGDPVLTSTGGTVAGSLENVYLLLTSASNQVLHDGLPLSLLDPKANGTGQVVTLETTSIDWTKSAIVWGSAAEALANKDLDIPLLIIYE